MTAAAADRWEVLMKGQNYGPVLALCWFELHSSLKIASGEKVERSNVLSGVLER